MAAAAFAIGAYGDFYYSGYGTSTGYCQASGTATTTTVSIADETGILDDRPELMAFPFKASVAAAGTYEATTVGTNFVLSGAISGDVAITATETCRVTLDGATMSGVLSIAVDAQLWLVGDSTIATAEASAILCTGTLTIGGRGRFADRGERDSWSRTSASPASALSMTTSDCSSALARSLHNPRRLRAFYARGEMSVVMLICIKKQIYHIPVEHLLLSANPRAFYPVR